MTPDQNNPRLGKMTKISLAVTVLLALAAAILFISPNLASDDQAACKPAGDALKAIKPAADVKPVPPVAFDGPDGRKVTLADYKGRGVVLNFWATWCAPCVREMPELDKLAVDAKKLGVDVLTVSMDREGQPVIEKFFAVNKLENLPKLHDPKNAAGRTVGVRGLPTTLLIDGAGREVGRIEGIFKYDSPEMQAFVGACLGNRRK